MTVGAGFEISPDGPQDAQQLPNADLEKWGTIIRSIGLKAE